MEEIDEKGYDFCILPNEDDLVIERIVKFTEKVKGMNAKYDETTDSISFRYLISSITELGIAIFIPPYKYYRLMLVPKITHSTYFSKPHDFGT